MDKMLGKRYELQEQIGGGGMAVVYLARDTFLDRLVAVKLLRDEYSDDQDFIHWLSPHLSNQFQHPLYHFRPFDDLPIKQIAQEQNSDQDRC